MIVSEGRVGSYQGLNGHGVFFHQIGDAGIGVDDQFIGKATMPLAIQMFLENEALAEGPVLVHQRHAYGGVSVEHLLGGDDLELVRIGIQMQVFDGDPLDRIIGTGNLIEIPVGTFEKQF